MGRILDVDLELWGICLHNFLLAFGLSGGSRFRLLFLFFFDQLVRLQSSSLGLCFNHFFLILRFIYDMLDIRRLSIRKNHTFVKKRLS